jgi:hypothetical protein
MKAAEFICGLEFLQQLKLFRNTGMSGGVLEYICKAVHRNLLVLEVGGMGIRDLPTTLPHLDNLVILRADNNPELTTDSLELVCASLHSLISLELDFSGKNSGICVPETISNLRHLVRLSLAGMGLATLPDSIGELECLTILMIYDNSLTQLPCTLPKLTKLTNLLCSKQQKWVGGEAEILDRIWFCARLERPELAPHLGVERREESANSSAASCLLNSVVKKLISWMPIRNCLCTDTSSTVIVELERHSWSDTELYGQVRSDPRRRSQCPRLNNSNPIICFIFILYVACDMCRPLDHVVALLCYVCRMHHGGDRKEKKTPTSI